MNTPIQQITKLADAYGSHLNITHWAVSMKIQKKGNFLLGLKNGSDVRTKTVTKVITFFHENWPADLEWPADIPRPKTSKEETA